MKISLIAAVSENYVIGKDNDLIWHLPDDMQYFKVKTKGHHIITGRKNYESIPEKYRPLKDRVNLIVTRNPDYQVEEAMVFNDIGDAVGYAENAGEVELFIIGGAEIYKQTISEADRLYITWVEHKFEGDAYFPVINNEEWTLVNEVVHEVDERHKYRMRFCTYERKV